MVSISEAKLFDAYSEQRDEKIRTLSQSLGAADKRVVALERELVSMRRGAFSVPSVEAVAEGHVAHLETLRKHFAPVSGQEVSLADAVRAMSEVRIYIAELETLCEVTENNAHAKAERSRWALFDGATPRVGQRVVIVREAAAQWGLAHASDDLVHEITSLLGGNSGLVECGPRQIGLGMLRLAPENSEVTCGACRGWHEQCEKWRQDAAACRAAQFKHDELSARVEELESALRTQSFRADHCEALLDHERESAHVLAEAERLLREMSGGACSVYLTVSIRDNPIASISALANGKIGTGGLTLALAYKEAMRHG